MILRTNMHTCSPIFCRSNFIKTLSRYIWHYGCIFWVISPNSRFSCGWALQLYLTVVYSCMCSYQVRCSLELFMWILTYSVAVRINIKHYVYASCKYVSKMMNIQRVLPQKIIDKISNIDVLYERLLCSSALFRLLHLCMSMKTKCWCYSNTYICCTYASMYVSCVIPSHRSTNSFEQHLWHSSIMYNLHEMVLITTK